MDYKMLRNYSVYNIFYAIIFKIITTSVFSKEYIVYEPNFLKFLLSISFFYIILILISKSDIHLSEYLIRILFIFIIIPLLSYYWQTDNSHIYISYVIISFIVTIITYRLTHQLIINSTKEETRLAGFIDIEKLLIVISVAIIAYFIIKYGIADTRALSFENVYEVRKERHYSLAEGYLINWLTYAILPSIMSIALYKQKYLFFASAITMQIYMYFFTANKTTILSVFLILIAYFISKNLSTFDLNWLKGLSIIQIIGLIYYWFTKSLSLTSIVPMRLLYIPANISFMHYDFFRQNPKLWFSENMIGKLFGLISPYSEISTFIVGPIEGVNYNTGYLGDAFDNGGLIIMLVYSVVLALIFYIIDIKLIGDKAPVYLSILIYSMIVIIDTPLPTTLLTGGLLINIIIMRIFSLQN